MYTKLRTKKGDVFFVVHGVLGESAVNILEEDYSNKKKREEIQNNGSELFRTFKTVEECDAYVMGLTDMDGWMAWAQTSTDQHKSIFGFSKAEILQKTPEQEEIVY